MSRSVAGGCCASHCLASTAQHQQQNTSQDFGRAVATLEALPPGPEADAQWRSLGEAALQHEELAVAARCAAALGDVARVTYLKKVRLGTCILQRPAQAGTCQIPCRGGLKGSRCW